MNSETMVTGSFLDRLRERYCQLGGGICFGIDPNLERIPGRPEDVEERIASYYSQILDALDARHLLPVAVKPNIAYFERLGLPGSRALERILSRCRDLDLVILLDGKRGDIGSSSLAYADAAFRRWDCDALTVSPYMGGDSLKPFTDWCGRGRGVYVLCRTSNPGAEEIQGLVMADGRPVYMAVADRIGGSWYRPGIGAVLGATAPREVEAVASRFLELGSAVSLLLPGIGAQGGSAGAVARRLCGVGYDLAICLFTASRSLAFAHESAGGGVGAAAAEAMARLRDEVGKGG